MAQVRTFYENVWYKRSSGIINTTINYAYKYLRQKLHVVSQFLYDDQIRGQLVRDAKHFRDNAEQLNSMVQMSALFSF